MQLRHCYADRKKLTLARALCFNVARGRKGPDCYNAWPVALHHLKKKGFQSFLMDLLF